ncbi:MAG: GNAT family N-acetyltransferase [Eggerthellaceae bacterium]|nr:GNAT family N-acetyltransferase [Eggerthellaceae bacterium]
MIECQTLSYDRIDRDLFRSFIRHQEVNLCYRREGDAWDIRPDPFIDDWSDEDLHVLVDCLRNTISTGGFVLGAFSNGELKGFASVESAFFGGENRYLDLTSLHVSEDMRGKGIGKKLFGKAAKWAKGQGAKKLYISSHSAVETQGFYRSLGCVDAAEPNKQHVTSQPLDCQLEYAL